jgi:adenine-specific DNA-methyltransferase
MSFIYMYNMDCLEGIKEIEDESVDLVVTSPPYNINKSYEFKLDASEYLHQQEKILKECHRILKNEGSLCWQVGSTINNSELIPLDIILFPFIHDTLKMKLRNRIIWQFGHGLHARHKFSHRYETIGWFTKSDTYTFNLNPVRIPQKYPNKKHYKGPNKGQLSGNPLGKNPGDVWDISNVKANHPEKTEHPCQFPEALVERLILSLTNEGDTVLDPFIGSGTTAVVCKKLNRRCIGFEQSNEYIKIAKNRLNSIEEVLI